MKRDLRLSTLTYTLFMVQGAIEKGHLNTVTFEQFYAGIDTKTLFYDFQRLVGDDIDLSLVTHQQDQQRLYLEMLESTRAALEGRERRKTGIDKSGLLLLAAYTVEIIQDYGWDTCQEKKRMDEENWSN